MSLCNGTTSPCRNDREQCDGTGLAPLAAP